VSKEDARALLREGIDIAKTGNKQLAYTLLDEATEIDPENEMAWLWLAGVAGNPDEATTCLQRVLTLNPENEHARRGLKWLGSEVDDPIVTHASETIEESGDEKCPACQSIILDTSNHCKNCGTYLQRRKTNADQGNSELNPADISKAIDRLVGTNNGRADAHTQIYDGIKNPHFLQEKEGLVSMQAATQLDPADLEVQTQVEASPGREMLSVHDPKTKATSPKVMIVDDSPTIRKLVTMTLEKYGHEVIVAEDGMEALARINDGIPDLILLDISMPRMDGYQLCKTIKGNQATDHIPIVMLTGKDGLMDKVRGRMVGSEDYLTKPFDPNELIRLVEKHISG
jgi:twitching motility two-component system response regulator PilG